MRVLFVHQDHCSPSGLIGDGFADAGWEIADQVVVPSERYLAPDVAVTFPAPADYDAVVFFGAAWGVYETGRIPWIGAEIDYARALMAGGVPVMGICFGGQMLAAALGGTVAPAPVPEIGWISVSSAEPGLVDSGPWLAWHFDRFTLPAAVPVAARTALAPQAFAYGRTLGLQFHPEVNDAVLETWLGSHSPAPLAEIGVDPTALIEQARTLADGAAARAHGLVRRFVHDIARRPVAPLPAVTAAETVVTPKR